MSKITSELITGFEHQLFWVTEEEVIFYFSENKTGWFREENEPVFFNWKINENGILAIFIDKEIFYWKIIDKSENTLNIQEYKNVNNKPQKTKIFKVVSDNFELIEEEIQNKNKFMLKEVLKNYNSWNYLIISTFFILIFIVLNLILNFIVIVQDFPIFLKSFLTLIIMIFNSRTIFYFLHKISYKIRNWIEN